MRIEKFRVQNYRSILDSGEVSLDPRITTLLGKNESGKTYTLRALESFEDDFEYEEDDLCLHSAARERFDSGETEGEDLEMVTLWFRVQDEDLPSLEEIDPSLVRIKSLQCCKYFDDSYRLDSPDVDIEGLQVRTQEQTDAIAKNLGQIVERAIHLTEKLDAHSVRNVLFAPSKGEYDGVVGQVSALDPSTEPDIESILSGLRDLPNRDGPIQDDIDAFFEQVNPQMAAIKEILSVRVDIPGQVLEILARFMYFSDVDKLEDRVAVAEFLANGDAHRTLANLVALCGLDVERVKDADAYAMLSALGEASTTITGLVNDSWTQERVNIKIGIVRDEIVVSISDDTVKKEHPPSIRSQGFQWFLSFYINFTAGSRGEFKNTVILLDDPGVYLHPSGQKDLLATLETISESNQVILSTHSPFMIDRDNLERIRIVSKKPGTGTLIDEKYYVSDFDALQPIRAAIGMTIGDALFATNKTLLVEGYSDALILDAMSACCSEQEGASIDTSEISVLPVNGADKMPYFATLLLKENLGFLILLDFDKEGRKTSKLLRDVFNIDEARILMLDAISGTEKDAELEDLISIGFYLKALNFAYADVFKQKLGNKTITKADLDKPSFAGIKRFFRKKKIGRSRRVDKVKVAKKVCDLLAEGNAPTKQSISDFSKLFDMINQVLAT